MRVVAHLGEVRRGRKGVRPAVEAARTNVGTKSQNGYKCMLTSASCAVSATSIGTCGLVSVSVSVSESVLASVSAPKLAILEVAGKVQ